MIKRSGTLKTVLHITHTDVRTDSRILKELKALAETGLYDITAIGVDSGNANQVAKFEGFSIVSIWLFFTNYRWRPAIARRIFALIELSLKVRKESSKVLPDVVHCHDTLALFLGWFVARKTGARLVYDAHELESEKNGQSRIRSKFTLWLERRLWKRVDLFISVSPSIIDWYDDNLSPKKSILILNSPEGSGQQLDSSAGRGISYLRDRYEIPDEDMIFIYVGGLFHGRNIETYLSAFAKIENGAHLVLLGYGELEGLVLRAASNAKNIHFHKAVPHNEVLSIVRGADVGLCVIEKISLSDYFCLPNKLYEYAFSGLRVLASNFPDLKSSVEAHQLGVCCEPDDDSIVDAIVEIMEGGLQSSPIELDQLAWECQAERLVLAYSELNC